MMSNVIAYYVLGTPEFADEVREFWKRAAELQAPSLWEAELGNVLWMSVRNSVLAEDEAPAKLEFASRLGIRSIAIRALWRGALVRAIHSGVSLYDTLFVELAEREGLPLVTFDAKLIQAYPQIAQRPKDFVA
jgi:predicted nucleic acid-binding protein